jgi:hypothetical protein
LKKLVLGAVAALLLLAPAADAKAFRGTVVKRNVATKTVVVATKSGTLRIVHNRRDRVGTVLRINGSHVKAVGHARRVHIKGVVTRRAARSFNLSASGAVVKVRTRGHVRSARKHGHQVGNGLNVTATVSSNGTITETASTEADDIEGAELKGTLVCTPTSDPVLCPAGFLKIDIGPVGTPNVIPVAFDPVLFPDTLLGPLVGQPVEAQASLAVSPVDPNAVVLTLTNISSQGMCQAEDEGDDDNGGGAGGGGGGDDAVARDHGGNSGCEDDD